MQAELMRIVNLYRNTPFTFEKINNERVNQKLKPLSPNQMLILASLLKKRYVIDISYRRKNESIQTVYQILNA